MLNQLVYTFRLDFLLLLGLKVWVWTQREREIESFPFQRPVACYYVRFPVKNSDVGLNIIDSNNQQGC